MKPQATKQNKAHAKEFANFIDKDEDGNFRKMSKSDILVQRKIDNLYVKIKTVIRLSKLREHFEKYLVSYVETRAVFETHLSKLQSQVNISLF